MNDTMMQQRSQLVPLLMTMGQVIIVTLPVILRAV
jgi:hypothetical protein